MGVQGCTLAERRRKVPASAIGAPIHVSSFPNCISNSPNTNHHKDELNNDNSKHHGDVINKHTTSNNSCLDKLDKATQESREFDLGVASGSGLQDIEDAAQQQASLWQGGQVGLFLVLCVNSMQFLLVLVFTVSMFCFNLLIHNSWGSTLKYFFMPMCAWVLWYRLIFTINCACNTICMYACILAGIPARQKREWRSHLGPAFGHSVSLFRH